MEKLDKIFKKELKNYTLKPSELAWQRVEVGLEITSQKDRRAKWAAVASVALILTGSYFIFQNKQTSDVEIDAVSFAKSNLAEFEKKIIIPENVTKNKNFASSEKSSSQNKKRSLIKVLPTTFVTKNSVAEVEKARNLTSNEVDNQLPADNKTTLLAEKTMLPAEANTAIPNTEKLIASLPQRIITQLDHEKPTEKQVLKLAETNFLPRTDQTFLEKTWTLAGAKTKSWLQDFQQSEALATIKFWAER